MKSFLILIFLLFLFVSTTVKAEDFGPITLGEVEHFLAFCKQSWNDRNKISKPEWMEEKSCSDFHFDTTEEDFLTISYFNDLWKEYGGPQTLMGDIEKYHLIGVSDGKYNWEDNQIVFSTSSLKQPFWGERSFWGSQIKIIDRIFKDGHSQALPFIYGYLSVCGESHTLQMNLIREFLAKNNFLIFRKIGFTSRQLGLMKDGKNLCFVNKSIPHRIEISKMFVSQIDKFAERLIEKLKNDVSKISKIQFQCGSVWSIGNFQKGSMHHILGNRIEFWEMKRQQTQQDIECENYYFAQMKTIGERIFNAQSIYHDKKKLEIKNAEKNQLIK